MPLRPEGPSARSGQLPAPLAQGERQAIQDFLGDGSVQVLVSHLDTDDHLTTVGVGARSGDQGEVFRSAGQIAGQREVATHVVQLQVRPVEQVETIQNGLDGYIAFYLDLRWDLNFEVCQVDPVVKDGGSVLEALARDTGHDQFSVTFRVFTRRCDRITESDFLVRKVQARVLLVDQGKYLVLGKQGNVRHVLIPEVDLKSG